MDSATLREEEEAATEFPSILKTDKKDQNFRNQPSDLGVVVRSDVNTTPPLTKKRGEI